MYALFFNEKYLAHVSPYYFKKSVKTSKSYKREDFWMLTTNVDFKMKYIGC